MSDNIVHGVLYILNKSNLIFKKYHPAGLFYPIIVATDFFLLSTEQKGRKGQKTITSLTPTQTMGL